MMGNGIRVGQQWCLGVAAVALAVGCSGDGCACMTDIPGGFPAQERLPDVIQARVTPAGLEAISENAASIVDAMFADGLTFDVPPSCGGERKVCCYVDEGYCQMDFDLEARSGDLPRLELEPIGDELSTLTLRARVETVRPMPVHQAGLFGDIECYVTLDTTSSGTPHITIEADVELEQDPTTGLTSIGVVTARVYDLADGDVDISGGFLCGFGDPADAAIQMRTQFAEEIPKVIRDLACQKCESDAECGWGACNDDGQCELDDANGRRCVQNIGMEGRLPAKALLGSLMPNTGRDLDIYIAMGGYGSSPNGGLSLGVLGGALPAQSSQPCVPVLPPPETPAISQSTTLQDNTHPSTGESFDVGLGIHTSYLDRVAWAAHQGGYLCIDVGAAQVPLLTSGAFAILAPSMIDLMHGLDAPLLLSIRPQQPPVLAPGRGTFTESGEIDEPLLTISMPNMDIDFYALVDQRYVRLLTLTADVDATLGLMTNELGNVTVVLGDLADALSNLRVTNSALLDESEQDLADKFPAVLSVALPLLGDGLGDGEGIALPAFAGLSITIGDGGFTSIEGDSMLAIFGDLVAADDVVEKLASVRTEARVVELSVPPEVAFVAPRLDRSKRPVATIALGGTRADGAPGNLEWQVRVDGGFWSPFGRYPTLELSREAFWLQGRHTVDVRAREIGAPRTLDPEPVTLVLDIGNAPVLAEPAPPPAAVVVAFHGRASSDSGCGCGVGSEGGGAGGGIVLFVLAALTLSVRREQRRKLGALFITLALCAAACSSSGAGDDDDDDDDSGPTTVQPGPTGRWADLAADGQRVVLSAYEEGLGDLVFATVGPEGELAFTPIDGVPDVPPLLDAAGYRGGITEPGDDVGAWTSIELFDGEARIAYQDVAAGSLKLAVEAGGDWPSHVVDPGADAPTGLYASLAVDAGGTTGIAYMTHPIPEADGGFSAELRWARATTASPAATDDWSITAVDRIRIPCTGLCAEDDVCLTDTDLCATPDTPDVCGDPGCDDGFACVAAACEPITQVAPDTAFLPEGTGLFASAAFLGDGRAVIAYYDHTNGDLYLALEDEIEPTGWNIAELAVSPLRDAGQWCSLAVAPDGVTIHVAYQDAMDDSLHAITYAAGELTDELIDDGWRDEPRPHPVGADATLLVDSNGDLVVLYQDSATTDLLMARRSADGEWARSDVLSGPSGYGFFVAAAAAGAYIDVSSYVYDRASWPPGETVVTQVQ